MENRLRWFYILPLLVLIFALPLSAGAVGPRVVLQDTNGNGASEIPGDGTTADFTATGDTAFNFTVDMNPSGTFTGICMASTGLFPILGAPASISQMFSRAQSPLFHLNNVKAGHPTTAPNKITVKFNIRFSTLEDLGLHLCPPETCYRDHFLARLFTAAGPYPILVIDPSGVQPLTKESKTTLTGSTAFTTPGDTTEISNVPFTNTMGTLAVQAVLTLNDADIATILANDKAYLHFIITNEDDTSHSSMACVNGIEVDAQP